jgi:hypothetical protein
MTTIKGRQLRRLACESLQFIAAGSPHCTQRVGLRSQQAQQVFLATAGIDQACGIVGDERIAFVVECMNQLGKEPRGRIATQGSVPPARSDRGEDGRGHHVGIGDIAARPYDFLDGRYANSVDAIAHERLEAGGDPGTAGAFGAGSGRGGQSGQRTDPVVSEGFRQEGRFHVRITRSMRRSSAPAQGSLVTRFVNSGSRGLPSAIADASPRSACRRRGVFLIRLQLPCATHACPTLRPGFDAPRRPQRGAVRLPWLRRT